MYKERSGKDRRSRGVSGALTNELESVVDHVCSLKCRRAMQCG